MTAAAAAAAGGSGVAVYTALYTATYSDARIQLAFTIGALSSRDAPASVLTASTAPQAALTAATTRTGGSS